MQVTPGGVHSQRRQTNPPLAVASARGPYVWDSDGRKYIDFQAAYGCTIIGHGDRRIAEAIFRGYQEVDLTGVGVTAGEVELAERLVEHVPSMEQVLLCNTGSEATMHAVRLARGVTGRTKVVKFQGAYHGTHDYLLSNDLAPELNLEGGDDPDPQLGVLPAAVAETIVCRYNDLDSVSTIFDAYGDEVAAVFVEPYAHNIGGAAPQPGFLEGLRTVCDARGALLVFDEVITGIRHGLGGYQAIAGVTPDLTTMAKALANGVPVGAMGGRAEFMTAFNTGESGKVLYSGTFNGNGPAVRAALTTMDILSEPGAYEHIAKLGDRMRAGLETIFARAGVEAWFGGLNGVFHTMVGPGPVTCQDDLAKQDETLYFEYRRQMLLNGVLDSPNAQAMRSHITLSHSDTDIDNALAAAEKSITDALRAVGR